MEVFYVRDPSQSEYEVMRQNMGLIWALFISYLMGSERRIEMFQGDRN